MKKQLLIVVMTVSGLMAMPSIALGKPVLTQPTGTVLATGNQIEAHSVGETSFTSSLGTISCSSTALVGTLVKNNTAEGVEANIESATISGTGTQAAGEPAAECTSWAGGVSVTPNPVTNGLPWCLKATGTTDEIQIRGAGCSSATRPIRLVMAFTGLTGTCVYQRSEALLGTADTDTAAGDLILHIGAQPASKFEGSVACPSEVQANLTITIKLHKSITIETYLSS